MLSTPIRTHRIIVHDQEVTLETYSLPANIKECRQALHANNIRQVTGRDTIPNYMLEIVNALEAPFKLRQQEYDQLSTMIKDFRPNVTDEEIQKFYVVPAGIYYSLC